MENLCENCDWPFTVTEFGGFSPDDCLVHEVSVADYIETYCHQCYLDAKKRTDVEISIESTRNVKNKLFCCKCATTDVTRLAACKECRRLYCIACFGDKRKCSKLQCQEMLAICADCEARGRLYLVHRKVLYCTQRKHQKRFLQIQLKYNLY